MQLHGPAKSLQLARMSFENKITRQALGMGELSVEKAIQLGGPLKENQKNTAGIAKLIVFEGLYWTKCV